ncbi:hypothetical protein FIBSPDRAFT_774582 [Athelia psychrophila]|uniref:Senescence domain-containing protein n=1 Tax=Athelia psychrophila TaxID=1759441 RepID=A0A166VDK3_9AGAM|nr:hypothetical protein FIBSPDRAFT_774582 [Fibularhizoctonia sp. CBS 109695]
MEAFVLLNLANASLSVGKDNRIGNLALECVTLHAGHRPDSKAPPGRDVFLVLRIDSLETPLDPSEAIQCSITNAKRRYSVLDGSGELVTIELPAPNPGKDGDHIREDLETFDSILSQYAQFKSPGSSSQARPPISLRASSIIVDKKGDDLKGHVILMDEDNGQVVGELENNFVVEKDPSGDPKAGEDEPVVIELRNEAGEPEEDPRAVFVRAIPEGHGNYITKGASLVSYVISGTTSLVTYAMTSASTYYIRNSQAQPPSSSKSPGAGPPPLPPRALVVLTSERTRKGLATMHAMSGQVASISAKTAKAIGVLESKIIRTAVGKGKEVYAQTSTQSPSTLGPPLPSRSQTPSASSSAVHSRAASPQPSFSSPPPYAVYTSRNPPSLPPRPSAPKVDPSIPLPSNPRRLIASADLILSTIDTSAKQLVDVGSKQLGAVMGHKYGAEAEQSTNYVTGTARNVVLVFIDIKGVGRRALIKNAGKAAGKEMIARRKVVEVSTTSNEKHEIQVKA